MKIAYIGIDLLITTLYSFFKQNCEIVKIFTCETDNKTEFNTQIINFAIKHDIPFSVSPITVNDLEQLKSNGVDFVVSAGYYHRIPTTVDIPIVNFHPSLLPEGRGAWPMAVSILNEHKYSGVSVHKVVDKLDCGDILLQQKFKLSERENHSSFMKKVDNAIKKLVPTLLHDFKELFDNALPQFEGSYWELPSKADCTITSDMSYFQIDKIFRAFYGYEVYFTDDTGEYELIFASIKKHKNLFKKPFKSLPQGYIYSNIINVIKNY